MSDVEDVIAAVAKDVHVKLLAEAEVNKRLTSSRAGMVHLRDDLQMSSMAVSRRLMSALASMGHTEDEVASAGVGYETIRKLPKA